MTRVDVDLPAGPWVQVPVAGDLGQWAERTADELCADREPPGPLAAELATIAERLQPLDPLACAVLVPETLPQTIVGVLVVHQVACAEDADAVLAELAAESAADIVSPELTRADLPLGPAARRHGVNAAADGTVVETVEHVVPLGRGTGLRIDLSWGAVALGPELVALADAAAAGLRLTDG
ncbi:hypothetical protein [Blastococcus sp. LR1]|uniref:hypothetical protein n=1 Tax=Blastococcus sp. LR1 TaxID=2877000 RepID=UPI001CCEE330|nr:hypothetical protein [Blastococcus sp. LR1]MCA0144612.1 hypothetical protein [Blastococcus sp. LR1]